MICDKTGIRICIPDPATQRAHYFLALEVDTERNIARYYLDYVMQAWLYSSTFFHNEWLLPVFLEWMVD